VTLIDPEDLELATLRALGGFAGCRVLEIGAGDGRLTFDLSPAAALWLAVELDADELQAARHDLPHLDEAGRVRLLRGDARRLALPAAACDVVCFTWSLCCLPAGDLAAALAEARRVLRPGGALFDVHADGAPLELALWTLRPGARAESVAPADYARTPLGALTPSAEHGFAAATAALAAAPALGYTLAEAVTFDYRLFFDTLDELADYLEENDELGRASDAVLEAALLALQAATRPARLVLTEVARVTRLVRA
jgi:SAM-dependent methyltransferase